MDRHSYWLTLKSCPIFSKEEERKLWVKCHRKNGHNDEEARRLLIESMLRLTLQWVLHWANQRGINPDSALMEDLLGEANLTVVDVVDNRFNPDKNCRLATILTYYLRRNLIQYQARQHIVKVPEYYCHDKTGRPRSYQPFVDDAVRPTVSINDDTIVDYHAQDDEDTVPDKEKYLPWVRERLDVMLDVAVQQRQIFLDYVDHGLAYADIMHKYHVKKSEVCYAIAKIKRRLRAIYLAENNDIE